MAEALAQIELEESDDALMACVAARDAVAFRTIVERHLTSVHRVAYRMLGDAAGAEDVAQIDKAGSERTKGFDTESWNYRSEAAAQRSKASGAIVSGFMNAASTALGGASQMAKMRPKSGFGG